MPNSKELLEKLGISMEEGWKSNDMLQSHLRDYHSERGGLFIDRHYEALNFPKNLVSSLNLLMKAHNMSINQLDVQLSNRVAGGEKELNLKQLACILCVADSLEYSETRIVDGVLEMLKERIKNETDREALTSYRENMKHVCVGDSLAIGGDNRIIISGTFNDPEVLNLTHKTIDYIEDWVRNYIDIDYRSPLNRLLVLGDKVVRNLTILGSDFVRLGIRIKKDHIIKLISSNSTWTYNSAAIKELLQNSVEACRYRRFNSSSADNYSPKVTVTLDKKNRRITISDNGCGMSRNTILVNFLTVGNSRSMDTTYSYRSFKSLARFGIGFWSVFTIASEVDISTAPFEFIKGNATNNTDGLQFSVSVSEFRDYTVFKEITRIAGTKISIHIKPEIVLDNLVSGLNDILLCSEIPIEIWNDDELFVVPTNVILPTLKNITEAKYEFALFQKIKEFVFEKQYDELEFKIKLLYRTGSNGTTFMLEDGHNSIMIITKTSGIRFATCGFAVNTKLFDIDCVFNLGGVGFVICNTNNPDGFIFNILRLELLPSKRQQEVIDLNRVCL